LDILLEFCASCMWHSIDTSTCLPLPSGGSRGRSFRKPCGSPPSSVLWARTTARRPFPATSGLPWRQVLRVEGLFASRGTPSFPSGPGSFRVGPNRTLTRERSEALLGSREVLLKACPGLATPATPEQPRIIGCLDAAFRDRNGVGIAMINDFGAESSRPAFLLCTLRTRRSPDERQHSLLVCLLRL
jgi:hypothetical protein